MPRYSELSEAQVEQFIADGVVTIPGALPREFCEAEVKKAWVRLGIDEHDPSTWNFVRTNMPNLDRFEYEKVAPRAWAAIGDLLGADRVKSPAGFGNNMIVVLNNANTPWVAPSPEAGGWHKDGDWFNHFLDSPEQALLIIVLWRDINPFGGGTFYACDSVGEIARWYVNKPEGGYIDGPSMNAALHRCRDFREATGKAGDIILMHPYMLHAASINTLAQPRVICNACVSLKEPMNFNREDAREFSALELSVLRKLGVERLDFKITGQRGLIVPQREIEWEKRRAQERERLAKQAT